MLYAFFQVIKDTSAERYSLKILDIQPSDDGLYGCDSFMNSGEKDKFQVQTIGMIVQILQLNWLTKVFSYVCNINDRLSWLSCECFVCK